MIQNEFFTKSSVMCRQHAGSSLELGAFYVLNGLPNKHTTENGHVQGLDWKIEKTVNFQRKPSNDHFKSLASWKQNIRKWEVMEDFCTILHVFI